MAESLIGQDIGRYKVVDELGRGQHSTVYRAWQPSLERYVALKVLHGKVLDPGPVGSGAAGCADRETLIKFQAEARLTAQLIQEGAPNIRQVYEVGQTADGDLFVALEYVENSLHNLLQRAREHNRRFKPVAAARLLQPVAQALDTVHSLGWVHLDIKPQNILIATGGRAILADFGIAQRRGMRTHACTPLYASPEQAAGDRPVGPWSDIYSLAVVLYEMVAGHPPVRGDQDIVVLNQHLSAAPPSPRKVNPALSPDQERALLKALAKSPSERFRTASELIQAMMVQESSLSSAVKTPSHLVEPSLDRVRRKPRLALALVIAIVFLAALLLLGSALWSAWAPAAPSPTRAATTAVPAATSIPARGLPAATPAAPTASSAPTATLAATPTPTLLPTAGPTRFPTLELTSSASPGP
jgi:serine/threonine protein kinase